MIGYVYLTSGAISTAQPDRYPARRDQFENLNFAASAIGDADHKIFVEKRRNVDCLNDLPVLAACLRRAVEDHDKVVIDDLRRLFRAVPLLKRQAFLKSLLPFKSLLWELRCDGRSLGQFRRDDLRELLEITKPVRFRMGKDTGDTPASNRHSLQTHAARAVSIQRRTMTANLNAKRIATLRAEMVEQGASTTLRSIAAEANDRGLQTSRGGMWSASSIKRALDRRTG